MQPDMHEDNFLIDDTGRICLVDFETVGRLPESFASYIGHLPDTPFVKGVASHLGWRESPNLHSLIRAKGVLWMCADPSLGTSKLPTLGLLTNASARPG